MVVLDMVVLEAVGTAVGTAKGVVGTGRYDSPVRRGSIR